MENGNIREYIERNLYADRMRLLSEVASGVYDVPTALPATIDILINVRRGIPS
jgi:hypothetical protein